MKSILTIQLKAAFLLIVFSLNTVIGFACAVGIDMGYNSKHHQDDNEATEAAIHVHADGKIHNHDNEAGNHRHKADAHKSCDGKDNCCDDQVTKFSLLDKSVPQSLNSAINSIFFTTSIPAFYNIDILVASQVSKSTKYFVRGHHPPIQDILIAIQRFQI
jgi:hypothetical protein